MSKIVLTEEAGVPSTPAAGKWTLYTKAGGLYYLDDAGSEIGPLSAGSSLTKAAYTDVATGTDDAKYVTSLAIKNSVNVPNVAPSTSGNILTSNGTAWTSAAAVSSGELHNALINGGFLLWQRITTATTATPMSDDVYNAPDRWYSLVQGANATINRNTGTGLGTSQYSAKLVAGGTTNRYGIAQIINSENSIPYRGKTVIAQCKVQPTNNAGSGTRDYRIAILEWTGTADTVTSEVVADWTSGTYTTAGFFASTTLTLVGTAAVTATHGATSTLSVSGTVSTSCNNLIVFIWAEDVPTHASDYALIGECGLYVGAVAQTWTPLSEELEKQRCYFYCYLLTHSGVGRAESATLVGVVSQFPTMRTTPTASMLGTIKVRDLTGTTTRTATTPSFNGFAAAAGGAYMEILASSWAAANFTAGNLAALMCDAGNGALLQAEL